MVSEELQKKIDRSIRLIKSIPPPDGSPVEVAYSGGKDSDVILQLVKESGIAYRAIYKNTTIDPPGTIKHVKEMGVEIAMPKNGETFFKLIERNGNPTMFYRFCCKKLKEYRYDDKITKTIIGVRKSESIKRSLRYQEPTQCLGTKTKPYEGIYPILDWTNEDVRDYIADRNIKCASLYYDESGDFHVERRLGCLCCPLQCKKFRIESFKQYPRMLRQYIKSLNVFVETHPNSSIVKNFGQDVYKLMYKTIFHNSMKIEKFNARIESEKIDCKKYLEEFFDINLNI